MKIISSFRNRYWIFLVLGVLCVIVVSITILRVGLTKNELSNVQSKEYNNALKLLANPEKYALTMSSTPGIRILAQYSGVADKVQYTTTYGKFLLWDSATGKISEIGQNVELPIGTQVYWTPLENTSFTESDEILVKATIFNKNTPLAEKQVTIKFDNSTHFYTVEKERT